MMGQVDSHEFRVLVVPPTRRDGEVTLKLLVEQGLECSVCPQVRDVTEQLQAGVGLIILTDVALNDSAMPDLVDEIERQPPWSDIPLLLLARDRSVSGKASHLVDRLTNVTQLDRPSSTGALVSAVKAALRARRRQYQIRDQLVAQLQAEEALRKADQRKDEFLATLAHELRNPLAAIRTGVELATRGAGDFQRTQRVVGMIDRQSRMLVKLIDDLMDVTRIATGKVALRYERLDLRSVVEASLDGGRTVFDASNHAFRLDLPATPIWVAGDATRLVQVVGNLINNAGKYTPDGGRISLRLSEEDTEAVLKVSDNGVGIAPELLEQVFEMFAQVNQTMDRARGGLGIGLSLARRLVDLHGGTLRAHSDGPGEGSEFTVRLPLSRQSAEEAIGVIQSAPATAQRLKVLVIDDNKDVAELLAALVETNGHDTRIAHDGVSGLKEASVFAPDIIFCDIGLPGISGYEVASRYRENAYEKSALMVAVTGWGTDEDKKLSTKAGFDLHITKPISYEELEAVLARF